jgi:putative ABC transport system permease protein
VDLVRLLVQQGIATTLLGLAIGAILSLAATRGLDALLYETPPRDPVTLAATAAVLLLSTTVATCLPVRRALRTNPADTLRTD